MSFFNFFSIQLFFKSKYTVLSNIDSNLVFSFSIVSFADYVEELGHPYIWVQTLGGLHFPNDTSEVG